MFFIESMTYEEVLLHNRNASHPELYKLSVE